MNILKQILMWLILVVALAFTVGVAIKYGVIPTVLGTISGLALWNWYDVFVNKKK